MEGDRTIKIVGKVVTIYSYTIEMILAIPLSNYAANTYGLLQLSNSPTPHKLGLFLLACLFFNGIILFEMIALIVMYFTGDQLQNLATAIDILDFILKSLVKLTPIIVISTSVAHFLQFKHKLVEDGYRHGRIADYCMEVLEAYKKLQKSFSPLLFSHFFWQVLGSVFAAFIGVSGATTFEFFDWFLYVVSMFLTLAYVCLAFDDAYLGFRDIIMLAR